MLAELQASTAVAEPVLLVEVSAGAPYGNTRLGGMVKDGAVMSRKVIRCNAFVLLPARSVAVQRREMNLVPGQPLVTVSL